MLEPTKPSIHRRKTKAANKQTRSPLSKHTRIGIGSILILILLIILAKTLNFVHFMGEPFAPDSKVGLRQPGWDGKTIFNLVFQSNDIYLLSVIPEESRMTIMKIPADTHLLAPFNFGKWPAASVYNLGQSEQPAMGAYLLKQTVSSVFGLPVDGYLLVRGSYKDKQLNDILENMRKSPFTGIDVLKNSKTDLSLNEWMKFWFKLNAIRPDKIDMIDLGQSKITKWQILADQSRVLEIDQSRLDLFIQDQFSDSKIGQEGLSVGIYNSTTHSGLAERAGRVVANMGGRVIFTSNAKTPLKYTQIDGKDSYTKTRLAQIFTQTCLGREKDCGKTDCIKNSTTAASTSSECNGNESIMKSSRADVTIVLGEDYYLKFNH